MSNPAAADAAEPTPDPSSSTPSSPPPALQPQSPPPPADPTHFDAIVLGTGLTNSITAAALVRAGKSVLHIDRNEFYAEHLASFDLVTLLRILGDAAKDSDDPFLGCYDEFEVAVNASDGSTSTTSSEPPAPPAPPALSTDADNPLAEAHAVDNSEKSALHPTPAPAQQPPSTPPADLEALITAYTTDYPSTATLFSHQPTPHSRHALLTLLRTSRQYNLELSPRIIYSRGALVDLLANSGVGRYLEFRPLDRIHLFWDGRTEQVPGSKEDVFGNGSVSLVEKRRLMKFLTFAVGFEETPEVFEDYKGKPYAEFLQAQKLSPRLIAFVLNATALIVEQHALSTLTTEQGLLLTQRHLRSLGRWGKTAFLVALYGAGSELSQAFCRLCAVYGGTYILNFPLAEIITTLSADDGGDVVVAITAKDGTRYTADRLVASPAYVQFLAPELRPKLTSKSVYRCVAIVDRDVHGSSNAAAAADHNQPALTVTAFPPEAVRNGQGVTAIQQSWDVSACPKTQAVIHLSASGDGSSHADVRSALQALVKPSGATVLLAATYRRHQQRVETAHAEEDVWWTAGDRIAVTRDEGGSGLDLEACGDEARSVFTRMMAGAEEAEFLPGVADPADEED
ncbi:hypothetical protein HDU87_001669 [Geranomyces variabilis]|uniref:Rab proteins geranylgeranyltransferase component A n=1 Tax=Geranomyces variabilis TaxID=109894 RepID=A0AAD5TP89_9FUNG|nr:hypothetical protein HDU87_001669 [Geranomyces variabilis]